MHHWFYTLTHPLLCGGAQVRTIIVFVWRICTELNVYFFRFMKCNFFSNFISTAEKVDYESLVCFQVALSSPFYTAEVKIHLFLIQTIFWTFYIAPEYLMKSWTKCCWFRFREFLKNSVSKSNQNSFIWKIP